MWVSDEPQSVAFDRLTKIGRYIHDALAAVVRRFHRFVEPFTIGEIGGTDGHTFSARRRAT